MKAVNVTLFICKEFYVLDMEKKYLVRSFRKFEGSWFTSLIY